MAHPELTENLIIFNRPHPRGRNRELATNNKHKTASVYIRRFKDTTGDMGFTAEAIARRHEGDALPTVMSYGHGDVVLGYDEQWRAGLNPWVLTKDGVRWYRRGSADH